MKKLLLSLGTTAAIAAPVANIVACGFTEYVVLPIKEPWASMIADGIKPFEFRSWIPKWKKGQKILIVATGKAESPRKIIATAEYDRTEHVIMNMQDGNLFITHNTLISPKKIEAWGGASGACALELNNVKRIKPILLSDLGIMRTPQKYQYWKGDIDNLTKWDVNK